MRAIVLLLGILLGSVCVGAAEISPNDFAYGAGLNVDGQSAAYEFDVPLNVYRRVIDGDLRDVAVFNSDRQPVPFAVRRRAHRTAVAGEKHALPMFPLQGDANRSLAALRLKIETGEASVDVHSKAQAGERGSTFPVAYVVDARMLKEPISALELAWPEDAPDYSGQINVEASDDLGTWRGVIRAPVVNLHFGGEQLIRARIECPAFRSNYLRLTWEESPPKFALRRIVAEATGNRVDVVHAYLLLKGAAAQEAGAFDFDAGGPLPVDRVDLHLPSPNTVVRAEILSRVSVGDPWQSVVSANFYRLGGGAQEIRSAVPNVSLRSARYWRVKMLGNSVIGEPPALRLGWVPHRVIFIASGTPPFELAFGNREAVARSVPVNTLVPGWRDDTESSDALRIGVAEVMSVHELGGVKRLARAAPAWRVWVWWVALVIAVGLLAWMAYRMVREMRR